MKQVISITTTITLLLSFVALLLVGAFNFSHHLDEHGAAKNTVDCPFMADKETICPMTALDHLAILKSVFEINTPSVSTFNFTTDTKRTPYTDTKKSKSPPHINSHTLLRWRELVTYSFFYRPYQGLFAQGILNPKLF